MLVKVTGIDCTGQVMKGVLVGVIVMIIEKWLMEVVNVFRMSDRKILLKLMVGNSIVSIIFPYVSHSGLGI